MDGYRRRDTPWMAVEGGMHLFVECSYQVPPNMSTKYVLYSKCEMQLDSYLTLTTTVSNHNFFIQ